MGSRRLSAFLLIIILHNGSGCNKPGNQKNAQYYSPDVFTNLEKLCDEQGPVKAISFIDSVYTAFPSVSAVDKYWYYDLKRRIVGKGSSEHPKEVAKSAAKYTDSMIAVIEKNGLKETMVKEYGKAFQLRGEALRTAGNYSEGKDAAAMARLISLQQKDSCTLADNANLLSQIYIQQGGYRPAITYLKEAVVMAMACKQSPEYFYRMQRYQDDIGFIYSLAQKYDSALFYHFAAAKFVQENKALSKDTLYPYRCLANIYGNISVVYRDKKDFPSAFLYNHKAIDICNDKLKDNVEAAKTEIVLADLYLENNKLDEANSAAQRALRMKNELFTDGGMELNFLPTLIRIAKAKNQHEQRADYLERYKNLYDSFMTVAFTTMKNDPKKAYEKLESEYQVELLKKDNRNQQNKITAAFIIGALLLAGVIVSLYLLRRLSMAVKKESILNANLKQTMAEKEIIEKELREKELFSQEMELQMEFQTAILDQRRQISDDMHDELSSSLAALKYFVSDMKNKMAGTEAEKILAEVVAEVGTIYVSARNYMHGLKTNDWQTRFSLTGFLKDIQQKFSEKMLMEVRLQIEEEGIRERLTTYQHDQLYHIVKECIANVVKHARATTVVKVSVSFTKIVASL